MTSQTVSSTEVDPGPMDLTTYGTPAWRSGSMSLSAQRLADGRLAVRARATIVARRAFVAQITIAPCDALLNPLSLTPDQPILRFKGRDLVEVKDFHKGISHFAISGIVSSNAAGETAPRNWTDCATADLLDQEEQAATLAATPENGLRVNTFAFGIHRPVAILTSTSPDGQHV